MTEIQQRTAEQLFRTLGELKGGAMKFGQALSVLEAALPDELAAPYREHLTAAPGLRAADADPDRARRPIAADLGDDWRDRLVWLDGGPTAAASIGQVHKGRWHDGREVAVKVQYPGAGDALRSDLRQLARVARTHRPAGSRASTSSRWSRSSRRGPPTSSTTRSRPRRSGVRRGLPRRPRHRGPRRRRRRRDRAGHRVAREPRLAGLGHRSTGTQEERDHYGELLVRFLFAGPARTGMLHADPHPGNFRVLPDADGGARTARRPRLRRRRAAARAAVCPRRWARCCGSPPTTTTRRWSRACAARASSRTGIKVDPEQCSTTSRRSPSRPGSSGSASRREWMRNQFERINDPRDAGVHRGAKLNLPPSYLLIHRTWLGGIGVLSQLEAEAPFRAILERVAARLRRRERARAPRPDQPGGSTRPSRTAIASASSWSGHPASPTGWRCGCARCGH